MSSNPYYDPNTWSVDYTEESETSSRAGCNLWMMVFIVVALVLLCCCCAVAAWFLGDPILYFLQDLVIL